MLAPKIEQKANSGNERADADSRRLQLRVERRAADQEQHPGHCRRPQGVDQVVGPRRLGQQQFALQSIGLLEAREVAHRVPRQTQLLCLIATQPQRATGPGDLRALGPIVGSGLGLQFGLAEVVDRSVRPMRVAEHA